MGIVPYMVEPPTTAMPHLPGMPEDQFSDFTHRDYRPDHVGNPTPKGIPYPILMSPQKAASTLNKVAAKSRMMAKGKGKIAAKPTAGKAAGRTVIASHGRK